MKTYYVCDTALKTTSLAELGKTFTGNGSKITIDAIFKADSVKELLIKLADFCNCNASDAVLNAFEEKGSVLFQLYENEQGEKLTWQGMQDFQAGNLDAYLCDYTFYIEEVISRPADL